MLKQKGSGTALLKDAVSASIKSIGPNGSEKLYVELPVMLEALQRLRQKKKSTPDGMKAGGIQAESSELGNTDDNGAKKAAGAFVGVQSGGEPRNNTDGRRKRILIKSASAGLSADSYREKSAPRRFGKWSKLLFLLAILAAIVGGGLYAGLFSMTDIEILRDRLFSQVRTNTATLCEDVASSLKKEGEPPAATVPAAGNIKNSTPIASARVMPPSFAKLGLSTPAPAVSANSSPPATTGVTNNTDYSFNRSRQSSSNNAGGAAPLFGDPDRSGSRRRGREDPFSYDLTPKNRPVAAEVASTKEANPFAFAAELKLLALKSVKGSPATAILVHLPTDTTFYVKCGDALMFTDKNNVPRDLKVVEITNNGVKVAFGQGLLQTVVVN